DLLPGLVADLYDRTVVVRRDTDAVAPLIPWLIQALRRAPIDTIYERDRKHGQLLFGPAPPEKVEIRENGLRFRVDVIRGQKTGFFLDQRDNRSLVRLHAGKKTLNLFGYTGGFSLYAAVGGASQTTTVDVAPAALDDARHHFALNGL